MIKILFIRNEKAFLPEINAYIDYFNKTKKFRAYDSSKIKEYNLDEFDVIWEFKGFGGIKRNKNQIIIHEYASLSTGYLPKIKDYIKSKLNHKPDLRIFLNENVRNGFKFNDNIQFCYRDMGIDRKFSQKNNEKKEYDYIYVGSICKERGMDKFLKIFTEQYNGKLCLVGNVEDEIYNEYKDNKNLIFIGKIPYDEVPELLKKAEYGINFIPDKYPYNIQTSTKLLEYISVGLKVITTDYEWIRKFEEKQKMKFYKIDENNMNFENIANYEFNFDFNIEDFYWDNIIDKSGIKNKIIEMNKQF